MVTKETEFNVEQHIKSPTAGMGFSLTEMLGRYLRKYWVKNTGPFFSIFIFKQSYKLTKFKIVFSQIFLMFKMSTMKTKALRNNCLFQMRKNMTGSLF